MKSDLVTVCPYCGKTLSGLMFFKQRRWHLDGRCVSKKEREKKQNERKNQPPLPLENKGK